MKYLLFLIIFVSISCSTVVTKYEYKDGKAIEKERIRISGIGKATVGQDSYTIESKPWVEVPSLPELELEQ